MWQAAEGCCRKQMSDDQACVWGKEVTVKTPNIDLLAMEGGKSA